MKSSVRLISILLCGIMLGSLCACGGNKDASGTPAGSAAPAITASPDGSVTEAPSQAPDTTQGNQNVIDFTEEPVYTDVPVITGSPEGDVTAGPTATPEVTKQPSGGTPAPTVTQAPGETDSPDGTPSPTEPPADTEAPAGTDAPPDSTPDPRVPHPSEPNDYTAVYTGASVDVSELSEGDTFYWTLELSNENSSLYAGLWLVEFQNKYITPVSSTDLWDESLKYVIDESYDNGEPFSDKPEFMFNIDYEGQTGSNPYGEAGKRYTLIGMYITSFNYGGVQASAPMIRIRYRLNRIPSRSSMKHDENGYYLPLRVTVQSSAALTPTGQSVIHGHIEVFDGKLYFGH